MFPLHQSNELCFQVSSKPNHHQQRRISQDLILVDNDKLARHASSSNSDDIIIPNNKKLTNGRRISSRKTGSMDRKVIDDYKKRVMHRDVERLRRQEMASLYSSLRSLLPLEYIKGKRSISDHIQEAVNYIQNLEKKIKEVSEKREHLKRLPNRTTIVSQDQSDSDDHGYNHHDNPVTVRPCLGGTEIFFNGGSRKKGLLLSRVLKVLFEDGISVVNCVSTKVNNDRLLHTIHTQVLDPTCLNLPELQRKLDQISSSIN